MNQSSAPQRDTERLFPEHPLPGSSERRRFRALARSAPWLSSSLHFSMSAPAQCAEDPFTGTLEVLLRGREGIAVRNESGNLIYQRESFTTSRSRDYLAATTSSWRLPASLTSPVYTHDQLVLRRPEIEGFHDLLPQNFWAALLDPYELAGTEPAAHDLAFEHPTYIHELAEVTTPGGRTGLAAVLSAGHSYQAAVAGFELVPQGSKTLIVLDLATGVCVERRVLRATGEPLQLTVLNTDQYYIDSLFTLPHPTLTDVRAPIPWSTASQD